MIYGKNHEGFSDPTAVTAIANVMHEEKRRKVKMGKIERGDVFEYTLPSGNTVMAAVIKPYESNTLVVIGSDTGRGDEKIYVRGITYNLSQPRSYPASELTEFKYKMSESEIRKITEAYAAVAGVKPGAAVVDNAKILELEKLLAEQRELIATLQDELVVKSTKAEIIESLYNNLLGRVCKC